MKAPPLRILVRQDAAVTQVGLIHLPDASKEFPAYGEVLSVGRDILNPEIVPGVRVHFLRRPHGPKGGALNPDNRENCVPEFVDVLCLHEDDLLAIVEAE